MTLPPPDPTVPPPPRRRTGRLAVLVGAGLLVLAGGGVAVYFLRDRAPSPAELARAEPRQIAERFAVVLERARNEGARGVSESEVEALLCEAEHDDLAADLADQARRDETRTVAPSSASPLRITVKNVTVSGDRGTATLSGDQDGRHLDQDFDLVREAGGWKVCGVYKIPRTTRSAPSSRPGSTSPYPEESR